MKKCPACAEEIQDEAIKCKHCGERIDKGKGSATPEGGQTKKKKHTKVYWILGIIAVLIILAIIGSQTDNKGNIASQTRQGKSVNPSFPAVKEAVNPLVGRWELMSKGSPVGSVMGEKFNTIEIHKDGTIICSNNGQTIFEGKYTLKGNSWIKLELSEEQKQKLGIQEPKPQTPQEAQQAAVITSLGGSMNPLGDLLNTGTVGQLLDGKPKQFALSPDGNELTITGNDYPIYIQGESIKSDITWEFAKGYSPNQ